MGRYKKEVTKFAQHIPDGHTCSTCELGVGEVNFSVHFTYGKFYTRQLCNICVTDKHKSEYPEGVSKAIKNYFESKDYR